MLDVARNKLQRSTIHHSDYRELDKVIMKRFDIVVCFFNSIAYMNSPDQLVTALKSFTNLLHNGGMLVFDITINDKHVDSYHVREMDTEDYYITRTTAVHFFQTPKLPNIETTMTYVIHQKYSSHSSIAKNTTIRGVFSEPQVLECIRNAGLESISVSAEYMPRTFVCRKP
jgi:hypothetical protein